jgi:hypothetical protein
MLALATLGFYACKQENLKPEGLQMSENPQSNTPTYDQNTLRVELENGMVSFVNSVKFAYTSGISETAFKTALIGNKNLQTIPAVGNELLNKTYALLAINANEQQIKQQGLREFAQATIFVLEYTQNNNLQINSERASVALFGGDAEELNSRLTEDLRKKCKWYQFGCHLGNLWAWIKNNPKTVEIAIKFIFEIIKLL